MTTITSIEQLQEHDAFTVTTIAGTEEWVRTDNGLRHPNGPILPFDAFEAAIRGGRVSATSAAPPPEVGQVYTSPNDHEWHILSVRNNLVDAARFNALSVYDGIDRNITIPGDAVLVTEPTAVMSARRPLVQELNRQEQAHARPSRNIEELNSSLLDALDAFDDEDDRRRIIHVLAAHGLRKPSRDVTFTFLVTGTTQVSGNTEIAEALGEGARNISGEIAWEVNVQFDDEYDGGEPDPCKDFEFTDERIEQWLIDNGFTAHDREVVRRRCNHCC